VASGPSTPHRGRRDRQNAGRFAARGRCSRHEGRVAHGSGPGIPRRSNAALRSRARSGARDHRVRSTKSTGWPAPKGPPRPIRTAPDVRQHAAIGAEHEPDAPPRRAREAFGCTAARSPSRRNAGREKSRPAAVRSKRLVACQTVPPLAETVDGTAGFSLSRCQGRPHCRSCEAGARRR